VFEAAAVPEHSSTQAPPVTVEDLGVFGAMAFLAVIQAGADAGFRHVRARPGFGVRLAPHRALRHLILSTLLEAGVLAPIASRRRLDDVVSDAPWGEDASLEDFDWLIVWNEVTRGGLLFQLRSRLEAFESTARSREVILQTWQSLAIGECLAFGEYALAAHNLNPALARPASAVLPTILTQQSIGQGCALMWSAAKHLASWFMRNGAGAAGTAERELSNSICLNADRATFGGRPVKQFSRHSSVPMSTFASTFIWTSRLGEDYWDVPVSEEALDRARPIGSGSASHG
jgi:hypothetical protein